MLVSSLKRFWRTLTVILAASCLFGFFLIFLSVSWEVVVGADFVNYYVGGAVVKEDGRLLYDIATNKNLQDKLLEEFPIRNINIFRAIPPVALLFLPLTYFPVIHAYKIFAVINFLILIVFSILAAQLFKNLKDKGMGFFLLSFLFLPTLQTIANGQISLILALITLFIYKYLKKGESFKAGVFSGLLLAKVQFVMLVPFLLGLSPKRKKYLLGFFYSTFTLLAISIFIVGPEWIVEYPKFLFATETPSFGSRLSQMWTFTGTLNEIGFSEGLLVNLLFYFLTLAFFLKRYKSEKLDLYFASAVLLALFLSVHLLSHDLALMLAPLAILLNRRHLYLFSGLYLLPLSAYIVSPGVSALALLLAGIYLVFKA